MDFGRFPPRLSEAETLALARVIQSTPPGPERIAARNKLVEGNLALVTAAATSYMKRRRIESEDIVAAGNFALIKAADKYDPDTHDGIKFSTYATSSICNEIAKLFRELPIVHISRQQWETDEKAAARVYVNSGDAREAVVSREHAMIARKDYLSLGADNRSGFIAFELHGDAGEPIDSHSSQSQTASDTLEGIEAMSKLMLLLSPIQEFIINARFGLDRSEPQTLRAIAADLGMTKERIRQIQQAAIAVMRQELAKDPNHPGFHGLLSPTDEKT